MTTIENEAPNMEALLCQSANSPEESFVLTDMYQTPNGTVIQYEHSEALEVPDAETLMKHFSERPTLAKMTVTQPGIIVLG